FRPFQHLTPFQAMWHPIHNDVFVIGRYDERRGIDFFDCEGEDMYIGNLLDPAISGLSSIAKFSPDGKILAVGSGFSGYLHIYPKHSADVQRNVLSSNGLVTRERPGAREDSGPAKKRKKVETKVVVVKQAKTKTKTEKMNSENRKGQQPNRARAAQHQSR
ncbi:DNA damage-binding protein 2, partial [Planoprotostelium fungivorum]